MASLILGSRSSSAWSGRTLVIGVVGSGDAVSTATSAALPKNAAKHLDAVLPALDVSAKVATTTTIPAVPGLKADKVVLVGLGEEAAGTDSLRRAAGARWTHEDRAVGRCVSR